MARTLSKKQVVDILGLIQDTHLAFMVELGGESAVSPEDLARLRRKNMVSGGANLLRRAYEFGILSGGMGPENESNITPGSFMAFLNSSHSSLTAEDQRTIDQVTEHMETHVRGLSRGFEHRFQLALMEADKHVRRTRQHVVENVVSEGQAHGDAVRDIAARLRKATKDMRRDWDRVAATELNNLIQEGRAAAFTKKADGTDPRVYKRPRPDACAYCKLLYLEDDGITPRVFRLSALINNGTNQQRKANRPLATGNNATQWKPVLDSTHPFCQCVLHHLPEGYAFKDGKPKFVGIEKAVTTEELSPLDRLLMKHECKR